MTLGFDVNWSVLASASLAVSAVGAALWYVIHALMDRFFVSRREHNNLADRVDRAERKLDAAATKDDMTAILRRLDAGQETFTGITRQMVRVETQLNMLIQAMLAVEKSTAA